MAKRITWIAGLATGVLSVYFLPLGYLVAKWAQILIELEVM